MEAVNIEICPSCGTVKDKQMDCALCFLYNEVNVLKGRESK